MKNLIFLTLLLVGCCDVKEVVRSTQTQRDENVKPPVVHDSVFVQDETMVQYLNDLVVGLLAERDSLRGRKPDTVTIKEYLTSKPFSRQWDAVKVTERGDSIFVTFRIKNADGKFIFREVSAPIKVTVTDTETVKTQEHQEHWYEVMWRNFKDMILFTVIIALVVLLIASRFGWRP